MPKDCVLVTGATGFIGAHVVDVLLSRGIKVRGTTRSMAKAESMMKKRQTSVERNLLEFVQIQDFDAPSNLEASVEDVNAVIHVASPFTYDTVDNEKELIRPAINGVRSILSAAVSNPAIRRVVVTSSFAAVVDKSRQVSPGFTYTADHWNPITYQEAIDPATDAVVAYRGSKKFAELEAWHFMEREKPDFELVTLCPPMTFGPLADSPCSLEGVNESNRGLWDVAVGVAPLPEVKVPFWIDVRDLAVAHVEAALRPNIGGRRFTPSAPQHFSYGLAARIIECEFSDLGPNICKDKQEPDTTHNLDGETSSTDLGIRYHSFSDSVRDLIEQLYELDAGRVQQ